MAKLTLEEWVARLKKNKSFNANAAAVVEIPAKAGDFEDYPAWVNPRLLDVLKKRGMEKLYRHQAQAIRFIRNSKDVVLVTPTASGKTLCYNLPVLQSILEQPETRALYLFPTKALAQDQMHEIHSLITDLQADIKTYTYDGDTPDDARQAIRKSGHVI
ncbi:MAG: DEAD/DEAH box helicase, partial [Smithellaceae bacterium]